MTHTCQDLLCWTNSPQPQALWLSLSCSLSPGFWRIGLIFQRPQISLKLFINLWSEDVASMSTDHVTSQKRKVSSREHWASWKPSTVKGIVTGVGFLLLSCNLLKSRDLNFLPSHNLHHAQHSAWSFALSIYGWTELTDLKNNWQMGFWPCPLPPGLDNEHLLPALSKHRLSLSFLGFRTQ